MVMGERRDDSLLGSVPGKILGIGSVYSRPQDNPIFWAPTTPEEDCKVNALLIRGL